MISLKLTFFQREYKPPTWVNIIVPTSHDNCKKHVAWAKCSTTSQTYTFINEDNEHLAKQNRNLHNLLPDDKKNYLYMIIKTKIDSQTKTKTKIGSHKKVTLAKMTSSKPKNDVNLFIVWSN